MKHYIPGVPLHDCRRLSFHDPPGLARILREYPLDTDYIDWIVRKGYRIFLDADRPSGSGFTLLGRKIEVGIREGMNGLAGLTLAHELIHTAVPDMRLSLYLCASPERHEAYEAVIDEAALGYTWNRQFIEHALRYAQRR